VSTSFFSRQHLPLPYVQTSVKTFIRYFLLLALAAGAGSISYGQVSGWDNSGNGLLNGAFYFRHVIWLVGDNNGDLNEGWALYGTINFNGNTSGDGTYTINATLFDGAQGTLTNNVTLQGTYTIAASGFGFIDNTLSTYLGAGAGDEISGLVSNQVFIGSSTENLNGYNDLFIATPLNTGFNNSSLNGNYAIMGIDSPTGSPLDARDALITFTANGAGTLSSTTASGYVGGNGSAAVRQSIGSIKYSFSNGGLSIQFPGTSLFTVANPDAVLIQGAHFMYLSPDGNFMFGGGQNSFDMYIGVKVGSGGSSFSGLYYQAGMDQDESELADNFANLDNYYGSFKVASAASVLGHQRLFSPFQSNSYDFTYTGSYTLNSDGSADDGIQHYLFDATGKYRIGVGLDPFLGISASIAGPTFTGSGVTLDPTGITNTASSALFTSSIAPGELLTIYGESGATLAAGSAEDATFPLTLDGVQVKVNGTLSPILSVNTCGPYPCVTFMVPYETASPGLALIQLTSKGTTSNTIAAVVGLTAPGLFTVPAGGTGYAAAEHANGSLISPSSPAQLGEPVAIYLTGLGVMSPAVADGAPGPSNPTAQAINTFDAFVGGVQAPSPLGFVGLTPTIVGLAQVNLTIPSGVTAGDNVMELSGPDSDTYQALISIGTGSTANERAADVAANAAPVVNRFRSLANRPSKRQRGGEPSFRRTIQAK